MNRLEQLGLWVRVQGRPVRCWSRMASGHCSSFTSRDKDKAGGVREQQQHTHREMGPLSYSCFYWCLWLIWIGGQCRLCMHIVCTNTHPYVRLLHSLIPSSFRHLSVNGCFSFLSLLLALNLNSNFMY